MITLPTFNDLAKKHEWLVSNKLKLIDQKKAAIKLADAFSFGASFLVGKEIVSKAEAIPVDADKIEVVAVINTTKLFDSHHDVHFDGLWSKSIKESKNDYLVKEHNFDFDGIITDEVKVSTPLMTWKELGFNYEGKTQALVYTSLIDKNLDKTGMFDRYRTGKVRQHSVGMRYVKLALAVDNKRYPEEQKVWKNYYDQIANKADVDAEGYFWAVTEAKNIEGSAVVKGSNFATPTISVQEKDEPVQTTQEPFKTLRFPDVSKKMFNELKF